MTPSSWSRDPTSAAELLHDGDMEAGPAEMLVARVLLLVEYAAAAESPVDYAAIVSDAVQAFVKPLLSEFGAAVLGFGVGAVAGRFAS